jgi:hypothetical protein
VLTRIMKQISELVGEQGTGVRDRWPADSTWLLGAMQLHPQRLGRAPELLAGDAGFYSAENGARGEAGLDPESFDPERGASAAPRATLVPPGAEREDGRRGPD